MSSRFALARCLSLFLVIGAAVPASAAEPFRYPEGKHGKGELRYINGLPVLRVAGTPEEIGEQTAVLGVKPAGRLLDYPKDILRLFYPGDPDKKEAFALVWNLLVATGEQMLPQFPAHHRAELAAIEKASGREHDVIVAANTMFDIKKMFACSVLIVEADRSATKAPLLGRNLDFPTLGYLQDYSLVAVYRPTGKNAFATVGFPGLVGCLSGMNDKGLAIAVLEVFAAKDGSKSFNPNGVPYGLCFRRILEECSTVEEAYQLLSKMERTTRLNLAVCDKKGGAILEMTPKQVVLRRPVEGICPCTNHFCTAPLAPDGQPNFFDTINRLRHLEQVPRKPALGLGDIAARLHAANQDQATLQTMIFEPATLKLHLAIGKCPTSALPLKTLELGPLLK